MSRLLGTAALTMSSSDDSASDDEFQPRKNKVFRERINFTNFQGHEFLERFRLSTDEFEYVLGRIGEKLRHSTSLNKALSPSQQLLTALHWLGNGAQYHLTSDAHGLGKSTVCRAVHKVVNVIVDELFQNIVKWPEDSTKIATEFMRKGGFPNVAGCVDGTLINLDSPNLNEVAYVDRYGNHSLNCLMVCGPDHTFYYVNARWPGSVNDLRVLRNSHLYTIFENGWRPFPKAVLLGDSGFNLKEWLIPPLHDNPTDPVERRFNVAHKGTRYLVECFYGILKERFPCLQNLRVNPEFAGKIIMACTTLHNIASKEDFNWSPPPHRPSLPPTIPATTVTTDPRGNLRLKELLEFFV